MCNRKSKSLIMILFTLTIIVLMTGSAELLSEKEIIFPEIAALTVGSFIVPRLSWNVSKPRMIILIAMCAVSGTVISMFVPLPLWCKINIAFIVGQFIYLFSRTTFAPMISAAVLPVMFGTKGIVYPFAAILLTSLIVLMILIAEKTGIKEKSKYNHTLFSNKADCFLMGVRVISVAVISFVVMRFGWTFCIAPPLLVAYTELTRSNCAARKKPFIVIIVVTLCALSGAVSRLLLTEYFGLPLALSAVVAMLIALIILRTAKFYLPPAAAMAVLAMMIPEHILPFYTLQVFGGISVLTAVAMLTGLFNKKSDKK